MRESTSVTSLLVDSHHRAGCSWQVSAIIITKTMGLVLWLNNVYEEGIKSDNDYSVVKIKNTRLRV